MATIPEIETTDVGEEFVHVRFRDPDEFDEIRTPDWAADVARSVSAGSEVRTGRRREEGDWVVQSVLVKKTVGESKAREQARKIVEKIEG
ncbi:hypothetical protein [Halobaculum marinum]|uniref:Uncharacterized protein n=1 Tax=Halobaculum marinum TaxID=3031996 RepID=A0ABD5X3B5_9EURY|nr:hypothetical protein [Halobaculum sp. DT55]